MTTYIEAFIEVIFHDAIIPTILLKCYNQVTNYYQYTISVFLNKFDNTLGKVPILLFVKTFVCIYVKNASVEAATEKLF